MTVKACLVDVYDTILNSDFEARMRAMIKLAARYRAQLVVFAYQAGLVTPRTSG